MISTDAAVTSDMKVGAVVGRCLATVAGFRRDDDPTMDGASPG